MPRAKRICFPGAVYHVYQRGNNKQEIFVDDRDRWHFLRLLLGAKKQFMYLLYCYVLMKNHFHVTIETPNSTPISKIMQYVVGRYAIYFNNRHGHKGHLFQGRFNDILVEKDAYLLELSRYIHLNPVKAGFVKSPGEYKWSSYNIYTGTQKDVLVDTAEILNCFSKKCQEEAASAYKNFVEDNIPPLNIDRDWLEDNVKMKRFIGSDNFIKKLRKRGQAPI